MKRNKPIWKHRKPGTQFMRRNRYSQQDTGRWVVWSLYVPQSVVGTRAAVFDLSGAVPDGAGENPQDPRYQGGMTRWRVDRGGKSTHVYAAWSGDTAVLPDTGDTWYRFTAKGNCTRKHCPLTRHMIVDGGREVPLHHPRRCPLGIPFNGSWKFAGRLGR